MTTATARSIADLEQEEAILEFLLFKKMAYSRRSTITMVLAALGLALQVAFLSVLAGLPFLLAALLMAWVTGFDNKVDRASFQSGASWESARFEQMTEILAIDKRMRKWDQSALDVSSGRGAVLWFLALLGTGLLTFVLSRWSGDVALIVAVDIALLLMFQWFNGMRTVHRQPDLIFKVKHLSDTAAVLPAEIPDGGALGAQLLMKGGDGESDGVPTGAKITVTWPDGPDHFHGVQGQVVVNHVQGTKHPYFYGVLVGREGHGLLDAAASIDLPGEVIMETQNREGVDVVIIRQHTTKTSGYATSLGRSRQILATAVQAAARYVASSQP